MTVQIRDSDGTVRLAGDLLATGGAAGDVLTQQADGIYAPDTVSGLPPEWTVGSDGTLTVDISDVEGLITLRPATQTSTDVGLGVRDNGDGTGTAALDVTGTAGGGASVSVIAGGATGGTALVDGRGQIQLFTIADTQAFQAWDVEGNVVRFALSATGAPIIAVVTAPADGDLAASQLAFWFDDNNATPALKIKAKSADGTVVTGTVLLT